MSGQAAQAAREVKVASDLLVIRELLEPAALREMCLRALTADRGKDAIEMREICLQAPAEAGPTQDDNLDAPRHGGAVRMAMPGVPEAVREAQAIVRRVAPARSMRQPT